MMFTTDNRLLVSLIGPLARWTHVQLSVIAMVGLLPWIARACGRLALGVQC